MNVNTTMVQRKYVKKRDECRGLAENTMGNQSYGAVRNEKDNNAILAKIFSECMFNRGWAVASPKTAKRSSTFLPGSPGFSIDQTESVAAAAAPAPTAYSVQQATQAAQARKQQQPSQLPPATYTPSRKAINQPAASYQQPTRQMQQQPYGYSPAPTSPKDSAPMVNQSPPQPSIQTSPQEDIPVYLMDLQL